MFCIFYSCKHTFSVFALFDSLLLYVTVGGNECDYHRGLASPLNIASEWQKLKMPKKTAIVDYKRIKRKKNRHKR